MVGANGSQHPRPPLLALPEIARSRQPTTRHARPLQIGGSTFQINANTFEPQKSQHLHMRISELGPVGQQRPRPRNNGTPSTAVGTYVAGTIPAVQLPTTGSYLQRLYGWLRAEAAPPPYLASGSYQNARNLQTRTGAFNGSFDGGYSARRRPPAARAATFGGNFSGGDRAGSLNGAFFASPSDAAKYQAGAFSIGNNSSGYRASGIFAGQR